MRRNTSLRLRMWWRSANGSNGALDRGQPVPCRQRNDPLAMNKRHCAQGREEPNAPLAKSKPGELNYGTLGIGSSSHLNTISFESMAGVRLTPVHYRGGAPALTDVIGGHTQVLFISVTLMNQPWKAGQLKALGGRIR
jgi:hypothetical protein